AASMMACADLRGCGFAASAARAGMATQAARAKAGRVRRMAGILGESASIARRAAAPARPSVAVLASAAGLLAAAVLLVDGGPGDALGGFLRASFLAFAAFDVRCLALLLVGVGGFVAAWHGRAPVGRAETAPARVAAA